MSSYYCSDGNKLKKRYEQRSLRNTSLGGNNLKLSALMKYLRFVANIDNKKVRNRQ